VGLSLLAAGCTAQSRDPTGLSGTGRTTGQTGGLPAGGGGGGSTGGGGGGNPVPPALVGRWQNTLILQLIGDIQTVVTTWQFNADQTCIKTVETNSAMAGFGVIDSLPCRFVVGNFVLNVTFEGQTVVRTFGFDFPGFSTSQLLLGDIEYERIG
jgi:hypothetical protein